MEFIKTYATEIIAALALLISLASLLFSALTQRAANILASATRRTEALKYVYDNRSITSQLIFKYELQLSNLKSGPTFLTNNENIGEVYEIFEKINNRLKKEETWLNSKVEEIKNLKSTVKPSEVEEIISRCYAFKVRAQAELESFEFASGEIGNQLLLAKKLENLEKQLTN